MKVCLVTGASRGAGRAVAACLGEEGAIVYVTGRSWEAGREGLPGTVPETAAEVTRRGGTGIPVRCDHTQDDEVEELFERIRAEQGHLDVLVNNSWGGYEEHDLSAFVRPFWEQPRRHWKGMFEAGVRAHLVASQLAAPYMIQRRSGLIVSTVAWDRGLYLGNLFYDTAKAAIVRMIEDMARELQPYGVSAVAVAPGFMRTERVMEAHRQKPFDLARTESTSYVGRAVAALARAKQPLRESGQVLHVGDLARQYGFTDEDGTQPAVFRIDQ